MEEELGLDNVEQYNRKAWDLQVESGNKWTVPVNSSQIAAAKSGDCKIVLTPSKTVPTEWLGDLQGKDVLCLAGGGGQQAPLLAAAGANVTTLDNSPRQLRRDEQVAEREGLVVKTVLGVMQDLSCFDDGSFDLIVNPCSNGFVPDLRPVWSEAFRVLRPGGELHVGFTNPVFFIFDYDEMEDNNRLVVRHKIPYSDFEALTASEREELVKAGEPMMFGHTLEQQLAGQTDAGFMIVGLFEDSDPNYEIDKYIQAFIATRARKPG